MKTVLIVDDSVYIRDALRTFLSAKMQLEVCGEAGDGKEAIEKAKAHRPDLILMDLSMPNVNGAEAACIIRKMMPDTRIIVFTIHDDLVRKLVAKALGVDVVVAKAEGANGLAEAIRRVLADDVN